MLTSIGSELADDRGRLPLNASNGIKSVKAKKLLIILLAALRKTTSARRQNVRPTND
jgi:hypothetical protein